MIATRGVSTVTTTMATDHIADGEKEEEIVRTAAMEVAEVVTAAMEERGGTIHMATTTEEEEGIGVTAAMEVNGEVTAAMEEGENILMAMATTMEEVVTGVIAAMEVNEAAIAAMVGGGEEGEDTTITTPMVRVEVTEATAAKRWRSQE